MDYIGRTREFLLHLGARESIFQKALLLRHKMTKAEKTLWNELKNRKLMGLKFRRQHPIHIYIADFFCHEKKLIIEVDGGIHEETERKENDLNRSAELDRLGISVIRFSNDQVLNHLDRVLVEIKNHIK